MKPPKNPVSSIRIKPQIKVKALRPRIIQVHVSESVKQSANYQTAEASYGLTAVVDLTIDSLTNTVNEMERAIEQLLVDKMKEQRRLLNSLNTQTDFDGNADDEG